MEYVMEYEKWLADRKGLFADSFLIEFSEILVEIHRKVRPIGKQLL